MKYPAIQIRDTKHSAPGKRQAGFTIIELMIATMVFAVVLLIVTAGILQIGRVYFKGVNTTSVQDTARSVTDTIGQAIQFGGGAVNPSSSRTAGVNHGLCVGNQQFSYVLGHELGTDFTTHPPDANSTAKHVLVYNSNVAGCLPSSPQRVGDTTELSPGSRELLSPHMRLAVLDVSQVGDSPNAYAIHVRVIYGDDDLLNNAIGPQASCKGATGDQFCAVSDISTVVVKRVK